VRDYPFMIGLTFFGILLMIFISIFYHSSYRQDSIVLGMTETIRTSAIANVDNVSRINEGELFLDIEKFEKDFMNRISKNKNINLKDPKYKFEYLKNDNGSIKAIRVVIQDEDTRYQATCKVDISNL